MTKREQIQLFEGSKVRTVWDDEREKWYFSIVDVVEVLTDSLNPTDYLKKMRKRDPELGVYIGTNCPQVQMTTHTGKKRLTLAADVEQLFRIIQSIPSAKAEPFKQWLARVGYERIQEIENPELAQERMKAVFGITPSEHKEIKGLTKKSQNLRDHMTDLELIFTMLGERVTTEVSQKEKPVGMRENVKVAKRGGSVAGVARKAAEKEIGHSVVSDSNFLDKNPDSILIGGVDEE